MRTPLLALITMTHCVACASTPPAPTGTVELRLLPGQAPVGDVDGPYAAYSRVGHGVVLRVWPESISDGMVDLSVIVRNTDLETIRLSTSDVVATGDAGPVEILGEEKMIARFDEGANRRTVSAAIMGAPFSFGGGAGRDMSTTDGVVKLEAPTSTYSVSSGASSGETVVGGISMRLPATSQTIILNVDFDSEDHEFALVYEQ